MEVALVLWLLFGIAAAAIASSKGRSGCAWFAMGVLLGPFGLLVALLPSSEQKNQAKAREDGVAGEFRKCPHCAESIRREATKCRYCQSEVEPV
ncbi:MAG: hypothetical protein KAY24_08395 [Candidatus Eisenbacteria sp.]|nr:hypothetical protein [Candidatus Eisenbacteria bacterium]